AETTPAHKEQGPEKTPRPLPLAHRVTGTKPLVGRAFLTAGLRPARKSLLEMLAAVFAVDVADGAGGGAHHQRFGGEPAARLALHAFQQRAVGDAGGGEDHVASRQFGEAVFAVEVGDADAAGAFFFIVVAEDEAALNLAA